MKTLERARLIKKNCQAIVGGRYAILYDKIFHCYRVMRPSRGIPYGMKLIESAFQ